MAVATKLINENEISLISSSRVPLLGKREVWVRGTIVWKDFFKLENWFNPKLNNIGFFLIFAFVQPLSLPL